MDTIFQDFKNTLKQNFASATEQTIKDKQVYLYNKSKLVVELFLVKYESSSDKSRLIIESEELERNGIITNGYGIIVFPHYSYSKVTPNGSTEAQFFSKCGYVCVAVKDTLYENKDGIFKETLRSEETLMHEIIHALDLIGYYNINHIIDRDPEQIDPNQLIEEYGSNVDISYPPNCKASERYLKGALYRCDPMEFYALMANVRYATRRIIANNPNIQRGEIKRKLNDDLRTSIFEKDIILKLYEYGMCLGQPDCKDKIPSNFAAQLMYCILQNKDKESFTFPDFFPVDIVNPDDLFTMPSNQYKDVQIKIWRYLKKQNRLFNEMVGHIVDDVLKDVET